MKYLLTLFLFAFPLSCPAQEATGRPTGNNIQIIDGKKFFSLNTARRQTSSSPSPSALAVMNHPRVDYRLSPSERLAMTPVTRTPAIPPTSSAAATTDLPASTTGTNTGTNTGANTDADSPMSKSESVKNELLSLFAPDDRSLSGAATAR